MTRTQRERDSNSGPATHWLCQNLNRKINTGLMGLWRGVTGTNICKACSFQRQYVVFTFLRVPEMKIRTALIGSGALSLDDGDR